ncbi:hypothetical protein C7S20_15060 [Christiangramia fulva]|uniref:DUF892 domain-containing protein n=1 Tax=Christiangramia fulva TaxID=2126553 RepID=A0A2R3Z8B0_9FLAO|nr:DUF892 family protein [Christiangramia fulva]AVR46475.1 hypothetical protein C7S20_15060 [Christiangramia fulva]
MNQLKEVLIFQLNYLNTLEKGMQESVPSLLKQVTNQNLRSIIEEVRENSKDHQNEIQDLIQSLGSDVASYSNSILECLLQEAHHKCRKENSSLKNIHIFNFFFYAISHKIAAFDIAKEQSRDLNINDASIALMNILDDAVLIQEELKQVRATNLHWIIN